MDDLFIRRREGFMQLLHRPALASRFRVLFQSVLPVGAAVILLMHLQRLVMAGFNGLQQINQF